MNSQSFKLFINKQKTFALKIYGFPQTLSWRFVTRNTVRIVARLLVAIGLSKNISAKTVRMTLSRFAMTKKFTRIMNCRRVSISAVTRMRKQMLANNHIHLSITPAFRVRTRSSGSIDCAKIRIAGNPIIGTFMDLALYDSQTLASVDSLTLAEMDYVLSN